jgi:hypothetical protein
VWLPDEARNSCSSKGKLKAPFKVALTWRSIAPDSPHPTNAKAKPGSSPSCHLMGCVLGLHQEPDGLGGEKVGGGGTNSVYMCK